MYRKILRMVSAITSAIMAVTVMSFSPSANITAAKLTQADFVHADGTQIIGADGKPLLIKGMAMGNSIWGNPSTPNLKHHTEKSFKELSEMGFNCVRFYLNYGLFESDEEPYKYKKSGFEWLDKNIAWAKKYHMGIIFNMHYPQGGYQSQGTGMELWTNPDNQKRLTALWTAIAKRYAKEPTVWGYGLINEPYLPYRGSVQKTTDECQRLMQGITDSIRTVSPYQAVFIEKVCSMKDLTGDNTVDWGSFSAENTTFTIDDDNAVYEFHSYEPMRFTHQNADWAGTGGFTMSYPSEDVVKADYINSWVNCTAAKSKSSSGKWSYVETAPIGITNDYNLASLAVNAARLGSGTAYFDDISLIQVAPNGTRKTMYTIDFSNSAQWGSFTPWSEDGSGSISYCTDVGCNSDGCLQITGTNSDFTASNLNFELKRGYKYIAAGYVRTDYSETGSGIIRLDFAKADNIYSADKAYLEQSLIPYVEFSKENNVPLYLGEFGVIADGFKENRNGEGWVSDMLDLCFKYNISFNYHAYHEGNFGLYQNSDFELPAKINEVLAEVFKEKLTEKK